MCVCVHVYVCLCVSACACSVYACVCCICVCMMCACTCVRVLACACGCVQVQGQVSASSLKTGNANVTFHHHNMPKKRLRFQGCGPFAKTPQYCVGVRGVVFLCAAPSLGAAPPATPCTDAARVAVCATNADVVFVVDVSSSVRFRQFQQIKDFLVK